MDKEKIDELIQNIAIKHNVKLCREDPILILHTMNSYIIQENKKNQEELLKDFQESILLTLHNVSNDSKSQVERAVNAAIKASKEVTTSIIANSTTLTVEKVNTAIEEAVSRAIKKAEKDSSRNKTIAVVNICASTFLFFTAMFLYLTF